MQKSTTQTKQNKKGNKKDQLPEVALEECSAFEADLRKRIRNKNKKLDRIAEIQDKIRKEKYVPNDEQKEMIGRKEALQAEIAEVTEYVKLYRSSLEEEAAKQKKLAKEHEKEVAAAKISSLHLLANVVTISTIGEETNWEDVPEELREGVSHYQKSLSKLLNQDKDKAIHSDFHWRAERDQFIKAMTLLVNGDKSKLPHSDTTYADLSAKLADTISSGHFPEVITSKHKPVVKEVKPELPEAPAAEPKEDAKPTEKTEKPAEPKEKKPKRSPRARKPKEKPASEPTAAEPVEEKKEEPVAVTPKEEAKPAAGTEVVEEKKASEPTADGEQRPATRGRGERGRGRGDRGRGNRGDRRPRTAAVRNRDGEDEDGFKEVGVTHERRGRGRGYRGRGGDRGGRGGYEDNGDGVRRGGNRGRGRGDRGRGGKPDSPADAAPTGETAN